MAGCGRAPHGARGLKHAGEIVKDAHIGRAPHGARGLKLVDFCLDDYFLRVAPRMGRVD